MTFPEGFQGGLGVTFPATREKSPIFRIKPFIKIPFFLTISRLIWIQREYFGAPSDDVSCKQREKDLFIIFESIKD